MKTIGNNKFYDETDLAGDLAKCHLTRQDLQCHGPDGSPCPDCGGVVLLKVETAWKFKAIREAHGAPIAVRSGTRCRQHQERLWTAQVAACGGDEGQAALHVARPGGSAHETPHSCALDLGQFRGDTDSTAAFIFAHAGLEVRLGKYSWGCHFDTAYDLDPNPDPAHYHKGARW